MKLLILLLCFLSARGSYADEPEIRNWLQDRYASVDRRMDGGDLSAFGEICDSSRYTRVDLSGHVVRLPDLLKQLSSKHLVAYKTASRVTSADTLAGMAKAAVSVTTSETAKEGGRLVAYRVEQTLEDTWASRGEDWILISTRVTSERIVRNGRTILDKSDGELTDWDRHYGRRSPASQPHGRT